MDDIRPPKKQNDRGPFVQELPRVDTSHRPKPVPMNNLVTKSSVESISASQESNQKNQPKPKKHRSRFKIAIFVILALVVTMLMTAFLWYGWATSPLNNDPTKHTFTIESGERPATIAKNLEDKKLIRSALAFEIYARVKGNAGNLKAGGYRLSSDQSVESIMSTLTKGQDETRTVMIPPGLTLKQLADPTIKGSFADMGFSEEEIAEAYSAVYDPAKFPLMKDRPAGASLEGYIFPETFEVFERDSLKKVLERSFQELYSRIQRDGLEQKLAEQGLNLHQALTLGSIVQEETSSADDQPQIAQVFLSRLKIGMSLGSDVTFIYAAREMGVTPVPELDSPYTTRIHAGLPPGPIATMNYSALMSVAEPAPGDYLFFVAGDDGNIYYSRTNDEHNSQVKQYCQKLCSEPLN